jgi:hypothetical protein
MITCDMWKVQTIIITFRTMLYGLNALPYLILYELTDLSQLRAA